MSLLRAGAIVVLVLTGCARSATSPPAAIETPRATAPASPPKTCAPPPAPAGRLVCASDATAAGDAHVQTCSDGAYRYFYPNGEVAADGRIVAQQREGAFLVFRPGGRAWVEGTYVDGVRHGRFRVWDRDGACEIVDWARGARHGEAITLRADGSVLFEQEYDDAPRPLSATAPGRTSGRELTRDEHGVRVWDSFLWNDHHVDVAFFWDASGALEEVVEHDYDGNVVSIEAAPR